MADPRPPRDEVLLTAALTRSKAAGHLCFGVGWGESHGPLVGGVRQGGKEWQKTEVGRVVEWFQAGYPLRSDSTPHPAWSAMWSWSVNDSSGYPHGTVSVQFPPPSHPEQGSMLLSEGKLAGRGDLGLDPWDICYVSESYSPCSGSGRLTGPLSHPNEASFCHVNI